MDNLLRLSHAKMTEQNDTIVKLATKVKDLQIQNAKYTELLQTDVATLKAAALHLHSDDNTTFSNMLAPLQAHAVPSQN